jgi:hypothetical protein
LPFHWFSRCQSLSFRSKAQEQHSAGWCRHAPSGARHAAILGSLRPRLPALLAPFPGQHSNGVHGDCFRVQRAVVPPRPGEVSQGQWWSTNRRRSRASATGEPCLDSPALVLSKRGVFSPLSDHPMLPLAWLRRQPCTGASYRVWRRQDTPKAQPPRSQPSMPCASWAQMFNQLRAVLGGTDGAWAPTMRRAPQRRGVTAGRSCALRGTSAAALRSAPVAPFKISFALPANSPTLPDL